MSAKQKHASAKTGETATVTPPLLPGKLFRPTLRPQLVARPRLLQELQEGRQRGRPLTLIAAPAGYGKSTLAAAWAQEEAQNDGAGVAWLSLDAQDNDVARFFTYLAAALAPAAPGAPDAVRHLRQTLPSPAPQLLMTTLLAELSATRKNDDEASLHGASHLLVLDDLQHLQAPALHEALTLLVESGPPRLHLVLVTREDPPLPLSRWRVRDLMTEIRARHLRFTGDESAQFLQSRSAQKLEPQAIATLTHRTEGWAAGLQLAALALRSRSDADAFVQAFGGSHRFVIDYLVEEVLAQLPPPERHFLRRTAVLNRICAPLCAALLQEDGEQENRQEAEDRAQAMLEHLEEANLFLLPLDDHRRWYRYHPLFADCLRAELDPGQRAQGHRRAAAWFADREHYGQAISHAVATGGDSDTLLRLVRRAAGPTFRQGDVARLTSWLAHLPADLLLSDPQLSVYHLLCLILSGRSREVPSLLQQLDARSENWQDAQQRARLLAIRAWMADITDSPQRAPLARQAAAALGEDDPFFSAFIAVPLGHAHIFEDRLQEAADTFRDGLALARQSAAPFARLSLLGNLVHVLNLQGRRAEALTVCREALDTFVDHRGNPLPAAGIPILLRGWLSYQANDLYQARADATQAAGLLQQAFQDTMLTPLEVELPVVLCEVDGEHERALDLARQGHQRAARQQYGQAVRSLARLQADLHLRHGRLAPARRWARDLPLPKDPSDGDGREALYDLAYLTYARLLLAEGDRAAACDILSTLEASARAGQRGLSLISTLLLHTVAGDDPLPPFVDALRRAAAQDYRRLFLDECAFPAHGPQLAALLHHAEAHAAAPAFVDELLASLAQEDLPPSQQTDAQTINETALAEPLTEQELVVLGLLVAGHSNRQIAEELVITVGTAKWHVHNIYGKLGVGNRLDAVLRAQALGLA